MSKVGDQPGYCRAQPTENKQRQQKMRKNREDELRRSSMFDRNP